MMSIGDTKLVPGRGTIGTSGLPVITPIGEKKEGNVR
jgi:hypothetical protein